MKILVTGGAGFIGRETVSQLVHRGHDIIVLDSLEPQVHGPDARIPDQLTEFIKNGSVEFICGRAENVDLVRPLLKKCNGLIHLAAYVGVGQSAYEQRSYTETNTLGASTLTELVSGLSNIERIVVASSISNYGEGAGWNPRTGSVVVPIRQTKDLLEKQWTPIDPEDGMPVSPAATKESHPLRPTSVYGLTKYYTEECFRLLSESSRIPIAAMRYGNVYGPGQALSNPYTGVMCAFYTRLRAGKSPLIFEDGGQLRRYTHVQDIAKANVLAIESDFKDFQCMNISSEEEITLYDLANSISEAMGSTIEPYVLNVARVGDVRHMTPDSVLAKHIIKFSAEIDLQKGLSSWVQYAAEDYPQDNIQKALKHLVENSLIIGDLPEELEHYI